MELSYFPLIPIKLVMDEYLDLSILTWNIRGALNREGKRQTRVLIRHYRPLLVAILETHCQFGRVVNFWNSLGYEQCAISEAQGQAGGVWLLKSHDCPYVINVMDIYYQAVTLSVIHRGRLWYFSVVYACPYLCGRQQLWNYLACLRTHIDGHWLLMGDFNEIVLPSEVKGGVFSVNSADKFSEVIEKGRLIDLGAKGSLYTWYRKESGVLKIAKRLD